MIILQKDEWTNLQLEAAQGPANKSTDIVAGDPSHIDDHVYIKSLLNYSTSPELELQKIGLGGEFYFTAPLLLGTPDAEVLDTSSAQEYLDAYLLSEDALNSEIGPLNWIVVVSRAGLDAIPVAEWEPLDYIQVHAGGVTAEVDRGRREIDMKISEPINDIRNLNHANDDLLIGLDGLFTVTTHTGSDYTWNPPLPPLNNGVFYTTPPGSGKQYNHITRYTPHPYADGQTCKSYVAKDVASLESQISDLTARLEALESTNPE